MDRDTTVRVIGLAVCLAMCVAWTVFSPQLEDAHTNPAVAATATATAASSATSTSVSSATASPIASPTSGATASATASATSNATTIETTSERTAPAGCGTDVIEVGEIGVGDVDCDGLTDEEDASLADLNEDGMVNILDDNNRDGVIDSTDYDSGPAVVAAADAGRRELDQGGTYAQAYAEAYRAVREMGVPPKRARVVARTGAVHAVGDRVGDGVSRALRERIIRFDPPTQIGLGSTELVEAVILSKYSEELQREGAKQGRRIDATIQVERVMQADLDGNKFTIDPPEGDNLEWKPKSSPEWNWQVTPDSSGFQVLSLSIMGRLKVDGISTGTNSESLNREIEVTQTPWQRISGILGAGWWPAFYALLTLLGGWALLGWRRYTKRREQRSGQDE